MSRQRAHRLAAQQRRGGPGHGPLRPLARRCQPPMCPRCLQGACERPAPENPGHHRRRRLVLRGRPQGLRRTALAGIAPQHPADEDGRLAHVRPHGDVRAAFDLTWAVTSPLFKAQPCPGRFRSRQPGLQGRTANPFAAGPACLARWTWARGIIKRSLATQTRAQTGSGQVLDVVASLQHGRTVIRHTDHCPCGPPAHYAPEDLHPRGRIRPPTASAGADGPPGAPRRPDSGGDDRSASGALRGVPSPAERR